MKIAISTAVVLTAEESRELLRCRLHVVFPNATREGKDGTSHLLSDNICNTRGDFAPVDKHLGLLDIVPWPDGVPLRRRFLLVFFGFGENAYDCRNGTCLSSQATKIDTGLPRSPLFITFFLAHHDPKAHSRSSDCMFQSRNFGHNAHQPWICALHSDLLLHSDILSFV